MYAPWIRALRSVARSAPIKTRIAAAAPARQLALLQQQQRRCLHASTTLRAAEPPPAGNPPNDGDKPDNNNNGKEDKANQDENSLFGEHGLNGNGNGNGETQGRQRRRINGSVTRPRRRTPEDIPAVQLPSRSRRPTSTAAEMRKSLPSLSPSSRKTRESLLCYSSGG
ncbi:hypothetical protein PG994_002145 [Apiospora phragmitis]|uniref:Uncharacterized protein n=1 Tax=Apiospora phragmitis TaxID=2905665 RepID=A0ABR1WVH9_9PEZI